MQCGVGTGALTLVYSVVLKVGLTTVLDFFFKSAFTSKIGVSEVLVYHLLTIEHTIELHL